MADKVRWGIISTARIATNALIPAIQASEKAEVVAIASREQSKAERIANALGIETAYGSYDELFDDPEVQAVYNPLPNGLHREWTVKAAEKGKHVLCEKPLALNVSECQQMIDACREHNVLLMEAFMYRFHPRHARVKEIIASGRIGEVQLVRAGFSFYLDESESENIRWGKLGGGALMDVGCYCVNVSRFIFDDEPVAVQAAAHISEKFDVDKTLTGILEFPEDRFAAIDCSFNTGFRQFYEVVSTQGKIEVPDPFLPGDGSVPVFITIGESPRDVDSDQEIIPGVNQYTLEVDHFSDCITTGEPPLIPGEEGLKNMRVIEALDRSAREGRRVTLEE